MPREEERRQAPRTGQGAAAVAATGAAGAGGALAPAAAGVVIGPLAIRETTAAALAGLRALWGDGNDDILWLGTTLRRHPELTEDELQTLLRTEADYGVAFRSKMEARLERDIPKALLSENPKEALRKVLEREKRYIRQRQEAMLSRAISTIERDSLKRISPAGAYWRLSPFVKEHTIDCVVMAGKFWPWEVLDVIHPPRHAGCPCSLLGLDEAIGRGVLPVGFLPPDPEEGIALARELQERFKELREAASDPAELRKLVEAMEARRLVEAYAPRRYAKGTVKGGQFMPRVGAFSALVKPDLARAVDSALSVNSRGSRGTIKAKSPGGHTPKSDQKSVQKSAQKSVGVPQSFEEFAGRVIGGAAKTAKDYDAKLVAHKVQVNEAEPDTAALRHWNGLIELGVDAPGHISAGAAAQDGASDSKAASGAFLAYSRAAHEVKHGINPISLDEYKTPEGFALEEALAEEVGGHDLARQWLAEDGHTDALRWLELNPDHPRAVGSYIIERGRLGWLLEEAGVPDDARNDLLRTMGYRQGHAARMTVLAALVGKATGKDPAEAREWVEKTLRGERDDEFSAEALLPLMTPDLPQAEVGKDGGTDQTPDADPDAAEEPSAAPQRAPLDKPAPEGEAVPLKPVSGAQGFDARHYSNPRRSLLAKMRALGDGQTLSLADGTTIERGPKGSFRVNRPDQEKGKLYKTPQRAVNAELAGILSRHGVGGDRLEAARAAQDGAEVQHAPAEGTGKWQKDGKVHISPSGRFVVAPEDMRNPIGRGRLHKDSSDALGSGTTREWLLQDLHREPPNETYDGYPVARYSKLADAKARADREEAKDVQHAPPETEAVGIPTYNAEALELHDFKAAGGSNGAQFATDKDGRQWLVKAYKGNADRVATELLANSIYREMGVRVPDAGQLRGELDFATIPDEPIDEPPLPDLPEIGPKWSHEPQSRLPWKKGPKMRKEQSTGMIVLEPDGRVWVYEPKGKFGGYENTFSKGRLEDGLSAQQNARKELWEEMGIRANPVAYLGDFEGGTTMTRFYVARRTSDPVEPTGGETEPGGVKLVSRDEAEKLLNMERDREILDAVLDETWPEGDGVDKAPEEGSAPKLAYPLLDGETQRWKGEDEELGEGFMVDALLGNWDVVGLDQDNVLWDEEGRPIRVDQGGTFEFRAMGGEKPFGPVPTEVWTMRGPKGQANGRMALDNDSLREQAGDIARRLTPTRIDALVAQAPFEDEEMRARVRENLKARVAFMSRVADGTEDLPGPLEGADATAQLRLDARKLEPFTPEEESVLVDFEGDIGDEMQEALRSKTKRADTPPVVARAIETMDGLLDSARAGEDFEAYMPVTIESMGAGDAAELAGKRFRENGYLEASVDREDAEGSGKALVRLLVPEGAKAFGAGAAGFSSEPGAVIFARGTSIRIAGAREDDGRLIIEAVVV